MNESEDYEEDLCPRSEHGHCCEICPECMSNIRTERIQPHAAKHNPRPLEQRDVPGGPFGTF